MELLSSLWNKTYGGAKVEAWLIGALVAALVSLSLGLVKVLFARRLRRWAERTHTRVDSVAAAVFGNTRTFFVLGVGLWAGAEYVELSHTAARWVRGAVSLIVLTQIGIWLQVGIQRFSEVWGSEREADGSARTMATATVFIAKLAIWSVLSVMALSSLGFEISALVRAATTEITRLERRVTFLATTASVTPFIGLFGTVWGIMNAFEEIGKSGSSSLAVVAPGISEALITTAMGLAAAIPAALFFNFFTSRIKVLSAMMDDFALEFLNIVERNFT